MNAFVLVCYTVFENYRQVILVVFLRTTIDIFKKKLYNKVKAKRPWI